MACSFKIKELKEVSEFIDKHYSLNLDEFTYVSLKIKIGQFCDKHLVLSTASLLDRLLANEIFRKEFLLYIYMGSFELFRDPALWRSIKDDVLKTFSRDIQYRVWIPSCVDGSDLLSFLILRDNLSLTDKIQVIYTVPFEFLNRVKEGFIYEERKHNLNLSNYKRIDGGELSEKYFTRRQNNLVPSSDLFKNTIQKEFSEIKGEAYYKNVNLIIYRNKLLNFKKHLQLQVTKGLIDSLKTGAFLTLGIKERLEDDKNRELFTIFNRKESIYKKIECRIKH